MSEEEIEKLERRRKQKKDWAQRNREKVRESARLYYEKNKERLKKKRKKYREEHAEEIKQRRRESGYYKRQNKKNMERYHSDSEYRNKIQTRMAEKYRKTKLKKVVDDMVNGNGV